MGLCVGFLGLAHYFSPAYSFEIFSTSVFKGVNTSEAL